MRINEISRKHGLENKEIINWLESIGVTGKSHSSSLDEGTIDMLLQHFGKSEPVEKPEPQKIRKRFAKVRRPKGWKPSKKDEFIEDFSYEDEETEIEERIEEEKSVDREPEPVSEPISPVEPVVAEAQPAARPVHIEEKEKVEPVAATEPAKAETQPVEKHPAEKHKVEKPAAEAKEVSEKAKPSELKQEKKPPKKQKLRTLPLEAAKDLIAKPEIIIEAPEIHIETEEEIVKTTPFTPKKEKEFVPKRDEDDAIRREIQKLKMKQKRVSDADEEPKEKEAPTATVARPARRQQRPSAVKSKGKRAWKREKRERREQIMVAEEEREQREKTVLKVHEATTVADVADGLGVPVAELIQKLISLGVMATINQPLDFDTIQIIADDYGFQVEKIDLYDNEVFADLWKEDTNEARMTFRPPVVTIMGHVDHGKTKLLDAVRQSDIVSQEAGGITQHIGAYYVKTPKGDIVFLDTPGHEAFTAMRARGAMVTDIVVLVVAATDGVMPQTIEAIHHAKAAGVPIIVAMNKIDLETANIDRLKQQLAQHDLLPEDWGGNTVTVPISAKQKIGIDELLETILLQAELLELKADPECRARGTILEGRLEQGRGPVATVLIQQGTLRIGDPFVTGVYAGRIRAMTDDRGESIREAGPSTPVEIVGIEDVPSAGDPFIVVKDDNQAKQISARLQQIQRERDLGRTRHVTLEDLHSRILAGEIKDLNVIVKGDVQGSVGAICENLLKIASEKVQVKIIHSGVGAISESDVMLASASNAIIIGFNVRPHPHVTDLAKREHVDIRTYRVIYDAILDIKNAMTGMLEKTYEEKILGHGEVREVFRLSKGLSIAGLFINDGRILRNAPVRLLRDSVVVHEGKLNSLKRFKDDVREVTSGYECGIGLENFNDIRQGDIIECYQLEEVAPTL